MPSHVIDKEGTERLHAAHKLSEELRARADGSYSRWVALTVFGATEEDCDELGWARI